MNYSECNESFEDKLSLEKHLYRKYKIGDGKFYKCDLCEYSTGSVNHYKRHLTGKHNIGVTWYNCDKCNSKFKSNGNLKMHKAYVHDIDVTWHNCDKCDSKFKSNGNLKKHKARVHNIDVTWHNCDKCDSKFKSNSHLKQHKARAHNIDVTWHNCDKCNSKFKSNSHLKRHKAQAHNIDVTWYNCSECDSKFKTNSHLKRHLENIHDKGDKTCELLQCNCFKLYSYRYKDKAIKVCRKCFKKCTGFKCRPEEQMVKHLQSVTNISPYIVLKDRIISHDSCNTKRRPDILISSGDIHIIVECDEKQHRNYFPSCESGRMDEIIDELKTGQIVFIRWNPDYYKAKKKDNRKTRLTKLSNLILEITSGKKELPHISVLYMYYDKDNEVICNRWYKEFI